MNYIEQKHKHLHKMDYSSGADYGYDQINVGSDNFKDFLNTTNANRLSNIDKIREREVRLLRKIEQIKPSCQENRDRYFTDHCPPSLYTKAGSYIEQQRMNKRRNIEDHYFSGKEMRVNECKASKKEVKEGFEVSDMKYLQEELDAMEKKNDMLILFIFFLAIVIMIQYAKSTNDPQMKVMLISPDKEKPDV